MKQTTFADSGFEIATKKTRKRNFLEEMNAVVPSELANTVVRVSVLGDV